MDGAFAGVFVVHLRINPDFQDLRLELLDEFLGVPLRSKVQFVHVAVIVVLETLDVGRPGKTFHVDISSLFLSQQVGLVLELTVVSRYNIGIVYRDLFWRIQGLLVAHR